MRRLSGRRSYGKVSRHARLHIFGAPAHDGGERPGRPLTGVVIPVKNESALLPKVLRAIPSWVVDTISTDGTPEIAMGARVVRERVVREPHPGYGRACLSALAAMPPVDAIIFLDGDASDDPSEMDALLEPTATCAAEFVVGSRTLGRAIPAP